MIVMLWAGSSRRGTDFFGWNYPEFSRTRAGWYFLMLTLRRFGISAAGWNTVFINLPETDISFCLSLAVAPAKVEYRVVKKPGDG